jgi:hypothetical protein
VAWFGVALSLTVLGATSASASLSSTSSKSTQQAFVKAVQTDYQKQTGIPADELVVLGGTVCDEMQRGQSAKAVAQQFATGADGKALPALFVSSLLVESAHYLCPKEVAKVKSWA